MKNKETYDTHRSGRGDASVCLCVKEKQSSLLSMTLRNLLSVSSNERKQTKNLMLRKNWPFDTEILISTVWNSVQEWCLSWLNPWDETSLTVNLFYCENFGKWPNRLDNIQYYQLLAWMMYAWLWFFFFSFQFYFCFVSWQIWGRLMWCGDMYEKTWGEGQKTGSLNSDVYINKWTNYTKQRQVQSHVALQHQKESFPWSIKWSLIFTGHT